MVEKEREGQEKGKRWREKVRAAFHHFLK